MKYTSLTVIIAFFILAGCSSKKETIDKEKDDEVVNGNDPTIDKGKINEVVTGSCQSGFFSMIIDGEEFCAKSGEYWPSLSSRYDNEQRDDLLKFWTYFSTINSLNHTNWNNISFVGTIANLSKTGDYKFDNSAYNVNKEKTLIRIEQALSTLIKKKIPMAIFIPLLINTELPIVW